MPQSYRMPRELELALVYYALSRPDQSGKILSDLDPDRLDLLGVRVAVTMAKEILRDLGRGPDQPAQALGRLARHVNDGKRAPREKAEIETALREADDLKAKSKLLSFESVVTELAPFLEEQLVLTGITQLNDSLVLPPVERKKVVKSAIQTLQRSLDTGTIDTSIGSFLSPEGILAFDVEHHTDLLSCRITELEFLRLARKQVGVCTGDAKSGKSQWASDVSANALLDGLSVYYASTEPGMSESDIQARVTAAVTNLCINDLFQEPKVREQAARIFVEKRLRARAFCVRKFPARITKIGDILSSFQRAEALMERPIDLLIIDHTKFINPEHENISIGYGNMYAAIANFTQENAIFTWCFHHCKGGVKGLIGIDDLGWSKEIVATIDVGFSINPNQEKTHNKTYLFAHRTHPDGQIVELPRMYKYGRYAPWGSSVQSDQSGFDQIASVY